ncbi:MAG TPA: ribosome assembly factor SBDS [archaeon]|nr:ribosome assembly factor SBDS [archaeon]
MVKLDDAVVVRYKDKGTGKEFEILADPDLVVRFRQDDDKMDPFSVVAVREIFRDARKGDRAAEADLKQVFETEDPAEIIRIILKDGEYHPTAEQKRAMLEQIRKQVVSEIARNAVDPRTGIPHTPDRISSAMKQAKVRVDFRSASEQVSDIVHALLPLIPLKFGKSLLEVFIPMAYASQAYGRLRSLVTVKKEQWQADGLLLKVEVPSGMKVQLVDTINGLTHGEAEINEIKVANDNQGG